MTIEFKPWNKIPRSDRIEFCCTEKVDGTSAAVQFQPFSGDESDYPNGVGWGIDFTLPPPHRYVMAVQSRTRLITPWNDNFGFSSWAHENMETLFADLGFGVHHGEWYGAGIQRKYGLTEKRFALFNSTRFADKVFETPRVDVVPVLYRGPDLDEALGQYVWLKVTGSRIVPGWPNPEGIVVRELISGASWKRTDAPSPKGPKDEHGNV